MRRYRNPQPRPQPRPALPQRRESRIGVPGEPHQVAEPRPAPGEGEEHGGDVGLAVRRKGLGREGRQRLVGWVADHPQGCEGQAMPACEGGGDVGFHVDGGGAGLGAQLGLAVDPEHGRIDARQIGRDYPGTESGQDVKEGGR